MDFEQPPDVVELTEQTRAFVASTVIPQEHREAGDGIDPVLRAALQTEAREAGIFAPQGPREYGGHGLDMRGRAPVLEEAGYSVLGPHALNCAAPDEGNMHLLAEVADEEQRERYLRPLVTGEVRSCFAMTEPPPGAGSDPSLLRTTARSTARGWVINGHKWFITGAAGAAFAICMARTGDRVERDTGATMFLIDMDVPGVTVKREIKTTDRSAVGGHSEVLFEDCEVPDHAILGSRDLGYRYAQVRLAPARLTHCMRWLGLARRAHEHAVDRCIQRELFGQRLGDLGLAQQLIADSEIDLHLSRVATFQACCVLDGGGQARQESAIAKVFVAEAVFRIIDRAIQLCGAVGVSEELPLARYLNEVRPFRIYDGPSEVHRWAIARRAVRRREQLRAS